jgi:CubicO group peptidase (beta-lactamase class C family)
MKWWTSLAIGTLALIGTVGFAQDQASLAPTLAPPIIAPAEGAAPLATPPAPPGAHALTKADVDAWLDGYLPYALKSGDIAGAEVAIVKDGQILTARGYGYADVDKRRPIDPTKTLFRPGSVSKLVTWTAVMQLVGDGKLDLDADVNQYLDFKIPPYDGKPVTLRNLLTHTAGFEETGKHLIVYEPKHSMALGPYLKRYTPPQIFAPGTTPAYSNWGTALAGYIVERKAGMSFDDYIEQRIFKPLGMTNTSFRQPLPAHLKPNMALGYSRASEKATPFEIVVPAPAGSMSSTATDMARFMIAHLQGGALGGNRILTPQAWQAMHNSPLTIIPHLNRMQLGFFETNVNGRPVNAHLGDTLGFHTSLHLFMRDGVGFYVSFNSGGKEGAAGTLRGTMFHDFADRYLPGSQRDGRVDPKVAAEHAKLMAGNWIVSRRWESNFLKLAGLLGQAEISADDKGHLIISNLLGPSGVPRKWVEIAPFVWRDTNSEDRVAAKVVDGKPVRWSMDFMSPFMVYDRVPASESAAWVLPALYASLAILFFSFLFWPAAWFVRRQYKSELALTGRARQAYRANSVAAGLSLALLIGWLVVLSVVLEDVSMLNSSTDILLWLLQILGAVVFIGALVVSVWNAWLTWQDGRRWTRKLWSVLVVLASLMVLYFAYKFGLIAMTANY